MKIKSDVLRKNSCLVWGLALVFCLGVLALTAPLFCRYTPYALDEGHLLESPSMRHILGTDQLGRDVFCRLIYGARISLSIGFLVVLVASVIGIVVGTLAGYFGGVIDLLLMRFTDVMLCFPVFFLILAVASILEPSTFHTILILGLTGWMGQARLMRAEALWIKTRDYVLLAQAYGLSPMRTMTRHIIPNAMGPVLVSAVLGIASAILAESSLSFLGLGVQPPVPSWGNMLSDAKATLGVAWWMSVPPGLMIFLSILAFHLIGQGAKNPLAHGNKTTA